MLDDLHPNIVTDKDMNPVAVQIPYGEWLRIVALISLEKPEPAGGEDLSRFVGSVHFDMDAVEWQRKIRDEWE